MQRGREWKETQKEDGEGDQKCVSHARSHDTQTKFETKLENTPRSAPLRRRGR